jgi:hypothetical protein
VGDLRREAEIETGNAGAAFQRMLAEPRHRRGPLAQAFALVTYLQRLVRHTMALAGQIEGGAVPAEELRVLGGRLAAALEDVATAVASGAAPAPRPDVDEPLGRWRARLAAAPSPSGETLHFLLGQIVSDVTSLNAAAAANV